MTEKKCARCGGEGSIPPGWPVGPGGAHLRDYTCSACGGTGHVPNAPEGAVSVVNLRADLRGTEETGNDRPAAPVSRKPFDLEAIALEHCAKLIDMWVTRGVDLHAAKSLAIIGFTFGASWGLDQPDMIDLGNAQIDAQDARKS